MGPQFEADTGGFQRPTADLEFQGVVAEQPQMARPRAGRDARQHRNARSAGAAAHQAVEVRSVGRFQFGASARIQRQPAQAVGHHHHDFGGRFLCQFTDQFLLIHK